MGQSMSELKVTVFTDYICPFCYVAAARLKRLRTSYDLRVNCCFLEIHPEISSVGECVTSPHYSAQTWQRMMAMLHQLAGKEGIVFREHDFTTNSRSALQLAAVAKYADRDVFYRLHDSLFEAFFSHGENIADRAVLRRLGREAGMSEQQVGRARCDDAAAARLEQYKLAADELGVRPTPTCFLGDKRLDGMVPLARLSDVVRAAV
jgi:predicted DsbA family dithiol-disulfide isomerase